MIFKERMIIINIRVRNSEIFVGRGKVLKSFPRVVKRVVWDAEL